MFTIDAKDRQYLDGTEFSSIYQFFLKGASAPKTRLEWLGKLLEGKSVIHFGCVDHLPLIEHRRQTGMWLHDILSEKCTAVVGIDINERGIAYMNEQGFEAYVANVVTEPAPDSVTQRKWDYIVAGEVLEHIDNPVDFLRSIREKYGACTERIVITVPNAFSYTNFRFSLKNLEMINSDHRFWFTPFTLMKVVQQAGITVEGFDLCVDEKPSVFSLKYWLGNKPLLRNRVVLVGKF
jgi:hypothetical protein